MEMLYARDPPPADEPACFSFMDENHFIGTGNRSDAGDAGECRESEAGTGAHSAAAARGAEWERFRKSLEGCGYFREEREVMCCFFRFGTCPLHVLK
jgi:hypothetical protein